jgi:hypothetical protein
MNQGTLPLEEYYRKLYQRCGEIQRLSFEDSDSQVLFAQSHSYVNDFEAWIDVLSSKPEVVLLKAAFYEYQFALLALTLGQYRQAFMSLRLFMELSLNAILLSSNELDLREWLHGSRDTSWRSVVDEENGLFSVRFVRAFFDELGNERKIYHSKASSAYRECSEYVHGNIQTHSFAKLDFIGEVFTKWNEQAKIIWSVVLIALCIRYLKSLDGETLSKVHPTVQEELGHIGALRSFFGGVSGGA